MCLRRPEERVGIRRGCRGPIETVMPGTSGDDDLPQARPAGNSTRGSRSSRVEGAPAGGARSRTQSPKRRMVRVTYGLIVARSPVSAAWPSAARTFAASVMSRAGPSRSRCPRTASRCAGSGRPGRAGRSSGRASSVSGAADRSRGSRPGRTPVATPLACRRGSCRAGCRRRCSAGSPGCTPPPTPRRG